MYKLFNIHVKLPDGREHKLFKEEIKIKKLSDRIDYCQDNMMWSSHMPIYTIKEIHA